MPAINAYATERANHQDRFILPRVDLPPGKRSTAQSWGSAFRGHSPAYLVALPAALLLAGAFPILATAREPDPARLEARDDGITASKAAPPPLRFVQAGGEPPDTPRVFNIAAQDLNAALLQFADRAGIQIFYDAERLKGRRTEGVRGTYTIEQALTQLLAGTQLRHRFTSATSVTLEPAPVAPTTNQSSDRFQIDPTVVEARQEDEEPDRGFKATMQTSATKTPMSIRETPQAISVITRDSMDERQVRNVTTALELSAGVTAGPGGAGAFGGSSRWNADQFTLRGQTLENARDVRVDGFASSFLNTEPDLALFERIEVIKGPSASLYGTGSLSGFVNRVTKKPQAEHVASVAGQVGSFDTYRTEFDVTGALDAKADYAARLIGVYEDSGSFIDHADRDVKMIAPSFSARLWDRTHLLLQGFYQEQDGTPSFGIPLFLGEDGKLRAPNFRRSLYPGVPSDADTENEAHFVSALLEHEFSDRWLASLSLQRNESQHSRDLGAYAYGIDENGETSLYTNFHRAEVDAWSGELRLDGAFSLLGNEHRLVSGVEKRETDRHDVNLYADAGTGNLYTGEFDAIPVELNSPFNFQNRLRTEAAYGQLLLGLTPRTRLIGGLRYENADILIRREIGSPDQARETADESEITWRVGLSQDLFWGLTGFATYATTYIPVTAVGPTGSVLKPETGDGVEFGLKGEWFEQQLGATLSVYRQERDKVPLSLTRDECLAGGAGLTSCSRSAGVQEFEGVELEINGNPWPELTFGLAASWQDGEFTERSDPDFGRKAASIIDRQTNLFLQYRFADGMLDGLSSGVTFVSLGDRGARTVGQYAEGYERVDLHFSYDAIPGLDLSLLVRNLFDERYVEVVGAQPGYQNYFGSPTAVLFRVQGEFDNTALEKVGEAVENVAGKIGDLFK